MLPAEVHQLEQRSLGPQGEATLGAAYELLLNYWRSGSRDRDISLHLLFLAWYLMLEPQHITGLAEDSVAAKGLQATFNEVHSRVAEPLADDPEFLFVVGLMAELSPWLLGDEATWSALGAGYQARLRSLCPEGIAPGTFDEKNAYGDYFAGQARVKRDCGTR